MDRLDKTHHRKLTLLTKTRPTLDAPDGGNSTLPHGIKVWYDPGYADVDIVFIHGLTGDRERTWTHEAALQSWPQAILPNHLPSARILTFGYDAYIVRKGKAVTNQLMDHSLDLLNALTLCRQSPQASSRPLFFVAHSLGGLVCKDAILHSRNNADAHLRAVFDSTAAIAFLGTPHAGSDLASWARLSAKALGVFKSTNTDLLSVLQASSEVLHRIQNDFVSMLRDLASKQRSLNITCFWESQPMPLVGKIVDRTSATLPGYNAISIHANHRDMVRFHAAEDPGFVSVLGELRRWVGDIQSSELDRTAKLRASELEEKRLGQMGTDCLKSLSFAEIGARKANIDEPSPQTCEWLFHDRRYQRWNSIDGRGEFKDDNFLWIKGKPGSGKSTLLKRIAQEHEQNAHTNGTLCLSFFFNARGALLEKSTLGLYRTLLFQLLQRSKVAMAQFLPRFLEKEEQHPGEKVTWQISEISNFFHTAISQPLAIPLYIFIDAMDECEEYEVRKVVRDFENSSAAATSNGVTVKICLSSRHYPHISLRLVPVQEIFVENHNSSDICCYVSQELNLRYDGLRVELQEGIVKKAGGIFFWVLFMVRRLLKAHDQGLTEEQMRNLLQRVPPTLEGLFEETLVSMEPERRCSFSAMAPWVMCAFRPLKLYELHVALAFTAEEHPLSLLDGNVVNAFNPKRFRKYVTDVSGGLFESISVGGEVVVQVIHESFREFFLNPNKATVVIQSTSGFSFLRHAHERILAACVRYFNVKELRQPLPTPREDGSIAIEDLTAMLCKPLAVPFGLFADHGIAYFHEYVFLHLKHIVDVSYPDGQAFDFAKGKRILESWLVFLYYHVIQTGALSSPQCDALDILFQHPWMVGLSVSDMKCITRRVNNVVIFVNKAMKDGFVLKEAHISGRGYRSLVRRADPTTHATSTYLCMFGHGRFTKMLDDELGATTNLGLYGDEWKVYNWSLGLQSLRQKLKAHRFEMGLAFYMVAGRTPELRELEECWKRGRFPLSTTPLLDWQIMEKLRVADMMDHKQDVDLLTTHLQPGGTPECSSILLSLPPFPAIHLGESGASLEVSSPYNGSHIITTRVDWELKHYGLWRNKLDRLKRKRSRSPALSSSEAATQLIALRYGRVATLQRVVV